jgi:type IV secretion system protein VirB10
VLKKLKELFKKEETAEAGSISMKDGSYGTVFGINKKILYGIGATIIVTFIVAIFIAPELSKDDEPQMRQSSRYETAAASTSGAGSNKLPNDYESLIEANKKAAGNVNPSNSNQAQLRNIEARQSTAVQSPPTAIPARVPSYQQIYSQPYALPSYMQEQSQKKEAAAAEEDKEEKALAQRLKSAIAFSLGSGNFVAKSDDEAKENAMTKVNAVNASMLTNKSIQIGTVIPAMLTTGINTDVAGQVEAMIEADVYDSLSGRNLLIPAGSRLVGSYEAGKASSDGRIAVLFDTLVLQNGASYSLDDSLVAVDGAGYMGIAGKVNRHTGRKIGGGMTASAIAALGSVAAGNTSSDSSTYSAGQLAAQGAMANLINSASSIFEQASGIQNTVTVSPGYEFNVYVRKGLNF